MLAALRLLNGTPPEVLENAEFMSLMLPSLRADLEVSETYSYVEEAPLACPISAFAGAGDAEAGPDVLEEWRRHTASGFSLRTFDGDHFFIRQHEPRLLRAIVRELAAVAAAPRTS
jgi:medium-chain acyl-[acyl-carrier-protein] hydrolase